MDTNIAKVAIDAIRGRKLGNYSSGETSDSLRKAFIELNGGSNKINKKTFHRGNELFDLVEEMLPVVIDEGITSSNYLMSLVDYRNVAEGDENKFRTKGEATFIVRDVAAGIQGVRRQRISDGEEVTVKTSVHIVKVYDELNRFLSGRIDFNDLVDGVAKSFEKQIAADVIACLNGVTANTKGLNSTYVTGGTFNENDLITLIDHVEAANNGQKAIIVGTKLALKKVTTADTASSDAKNNYFNLGYYGKFAGTDMVVAPQAHNADGQTFALKNDTIYVIAADDKPIKMVNEGDGLLIEGDATNNADLTQEYTYAQAYGTAFLASAKMGVYKVS